MARGTVFKFKLNLAIEMEREGDKEKLGKNWEPRKELICEKLEKNIWKKPIMNLGSNRQVHSHTEANKC